MNINPDLKVVSETYSLNINEEIKTAQKMLNEKLENMETGEVVAFGPKEHLEKLRKDLLKSGYKKLR